MAPTTTQSIDFETNKVTISTLVEGEPLIPDYVIPYDSYLASLKMMIFRKALLKKIKTTRATTQQTETGLIREFVLELPTMAMPKAVQKVLGSRAGRLNLDGTQKITIEGSSTKRRRVPIYETTNTSRFDFKMKQDTNLRLTGTIGEKIGVNLKYNSQMDEQLFDPNNV
ncbi:MAG TPA: hypothetical protein P5533_05380, partial [Candidatus Cloacimonadota bacterium]|nr:hypothetical protein [Candidatus Cloacimonadota bacterium]